jgi:uncharacterized protein YbbC (DUF1343 family)
MKKALAGLLLLSACASAPTRPARPRVMTGLDVLEEQGFASLRGKRVGVITNRTGVDARGNSIVDLLAAAPGVTLAAVYSSEHGFSASKETNVIASDRIQAGGRIVPLYSLFIGGATRPEPSQLAGLDALVFDIQDVGARFYTYLATMALALESAKEAGIEFYVLDRPNPIGGVAVQGLRPDATLPGKDPVAYFDVPTRHGLTAGEMSLLANASIKHPNLTVVKMRGWKRGMWYDQTGLSWLPPSPNMPDLAAATLYPGIANLEFTNLSVGRGTPTPFGWIGAPWLDADGLAKAMSASLLEGVEFSAETRTPTKDAYAGQAIPGLRIVVTDRAAADPLKVFARLVVALRDRHPDEFQLRWNSTRRLVGRKEFKELYDRGADAAEIERLFDQDSAEFEKTRAPFLLYPE